MTSTLNDVLLRTTRLLITDPYKQDLVVPEIPPDVELETIENTYVFTRWPQEKVWCALCRACRHRNGFTAKLSDGTRVLLGSHCGRDRFGVSWQEAEKNLKGLRDRKSLLEHLDRLVPHISEIVTELRSWDRELGRTAASHKRFSRAMPGLYQRLVEAARSHDGRLIVYEKDSSLFSEAVGGSGRVARQPSWRPVTVHIIAGAPYFTPLDPEAAACEGIAALLAVQAAVADTDGLATHALKRLRRRLSDAVENLRQAVAMTHGAAAFFSPDNLAKVASWATRVDTVDGVYVMRGKGLMRTDTGDFMELPPRYRTLDPSILTVLL